MMGAVLAATGLAMLLWPKMRSQVRARSLGAATTVRRAWVADPGRSALIAAPLVAVVIAGVSAAIAAAIAAATAHTLLMGRRRDDAEAVEQARLLAALEIMIAELRVGAHPAHACRQAADDGGGGATAEMLQMMAGRAALGGDVSGGITAAGGPERESWHRVAVAWRTAEQYGLPMAELLISVRADLLARSRFTARTRAALAGAKATALVLAFLPLLGIGLGQAMGAAPLTVLLGGGLGGILLVTGVALVCGGLLWSRHIVGKAAAR